MAFRVSLLCVLFVFPVFGKVIETKNIQEALATVDKDTLLIFDLDNTIVMPSQMIGGEEWFDYMVEKSIQAKIQSGVPEKAATTAAVNETLLQWNAVMLTTDVVPVEKDGPKAIAEKQAAGAKVMALTARPSELIAATHRQLRGIGIDFRKAMPVSKRITVKSAVPVPYDEGVIFAGAFNNKGDVLVSFLKSMKSSPKKIVFVDNKRKHVDNVEKALDQAGIKIDYLGCRHGASDAKIAAFDPKVADVQFKFFNRVLDDKSASQLVQ